MSSLYVERGVDAVKASGQARKIICTILCIAVLGTIQPQLWKTEDKVNLLHCEGSVNGTAYG